MFPLKTMDQKRAEYALICITQVPEDQGLSYGTLARGLPAMLQTNGLGSTLAFLQSKAGKKNVDESAHSRLFNHMVIWLSQEIRNKIEPESQTETAQFMPWLMGKDSTVYRYAMVEAMAFSIWLRRFSEAKGWSGQDT